MSDHAIGTAAPPAYPLNGMAAIADLTITRDDTGIFDTIAGHLERNDLVIIHRGGAVPIVAASPQFWLRLTEYGKAVEAR